MITEIPLLYPVTIGDVTIEKLEMRRSKVNDWLAQEKIEGKILYKEVFIIARLCGQPTSLIGELDDEDYERLQKVLEGNGDSVPLDQPENSGSGVPEQQKN